MPQNPDMILDHNKLFSEPEYKEIFENKKTFEEGFSDDEVARVREWTKTEEYKEKNFAREALVVNPAKACQPLGALFAAAGFDGTLGYVHGSQGCAAYFRSHLTRHFKEPSSIVSDSMTEDAAVFGGIANMKTGLENAYSLYNPKMIAVCTSCMAEVIGDDLASFVGNTKKDGLIPEDLPVVTAHTPSFVGSHITGYDNMMRSILSQTWNVELDDEEMAKKSKNSVNIITGFDPYVVGNTREIKRMLDLMGVDYTILGDQSDVYDTPCDGEFRMYAGGTTMEELKDALHAKATISLQETCTTQTQLYTKSRGHQVESFTYPLGVAATDAFLMKVSEITGVTIPEALEVERGRLVDAIADSHAYLHGKKFAVIGDQDMVAGIVSFLLEVGAEPTHIVCTAGSKKWGKKMKALLADSPFGQDAEVYIGKDMWHLRSLMFTAPVDFLIGNTYCKALERDTGTPLIRLGFPIFDRHHHHRFPTFGYQGGLTVLTKILDVALDKLDRDAIEAGGISFDAIR